MKSTVEPINRSADLVCRNRVSKFVEQNTNWHEHKERNLTCHPPVERGKVNIGEHAPILLQSPQCADAEQSIEEREEVEESHSQLVG